MKQPVPNYAEPDLDRIIARDFPPEVAEEVKTLLNSYDNKPRPEPLRVRMACLKLANGNVESLKRYVSEACTDYRDVLAWAEYPAYMKARGAKQQEKAVETDWQQLQGWLSRE